MSRPSKSPIFPTENDIVVVVMGPTGAGKSTFIQYAAEQDDSAVGHNLGSCTADIRLVKSKRTIDGRPIVFVDTPGFDDTYRSDTEILDLISSWLKRAYNAKLKLDAILFLHRISDNRMAKSPLENLELLVSMCDNQMIPSMTLVTTMWTHVPKEVGERREEELRSSFWKGMINKGCLIRRFDDTIDSALDIITSSLRKDKAISLSPQTFANLTAPTKTEVGIRRVRDSQMPTDKDIVIIVMGPTRSGKSTFIQYATTLDSSVGYDFKSCTQDISLVESRRYIDDHRIVFVDTPGFDDTYKSDIEILCLIHEWLVKAYGARVKIDGILYFHAISDDQMDGSLPKNLELFGSICGKNAMENVTLVTTKWTHVPVGIAEQREEELKQSFWYGMIERGCQVRRFDETIDSALDIVISCLGKDKSLLLPHRIVNGDQALKTTDNSHPQKLLKDQKDTGTGRGDIKQKIENISEQLSGMKVTPFLPTWLRRKTGADILNTGP